MDDTQRNTPAQELERCISPGAVMPLDIVDELKSQAVAGDCHPYVSDLIKRAADEIVYLRHMAGAVSRGPDHAKLKRQAKGFESQKP